MFTLESVFMLRKEARGRKTSGPSSKKSIILEYQRLYKVELTEAELNAMIEHAFSGTDIPKDAKKEVMKKLKEKKSKKKPPKKAK